MSGIVEDDLKVALHLADKARETILPFFRNRHLGTENKEKSGYDPVTDADREAEKVMRAEIGNLRPQDAILGEEFDQVEGQSGRTWVLDPIDGTRGFISGTPTWGVLIALSNDAGPKIGVIDQPYISERFWGFEGRAYCQSPHGTVDLRTSERKLLSEAILFTTFPEVGTPADRLAFEAVSKNVRLTRYGMDCYAYALLAAGHVDLVIEAGLNAFDIQAPIALIEAAGGIVTDWKGGAAHLGGRALAAANHHLHQAALELLNSV